MSKRIQRIPKMDTTLVLFYVDMRNILDVRRGNIYRFVPQGGTYHTETIRLVVREALVCEKLIPTRPHLPRMGQYFYHGMLVPFHDSMPRFMNFRRVLDLLELQKQVPQRLPKSHGALVFRIHPHFLHGT